MWILLFPNVFTFEGVTDAIKKRKKVNMDLLLYNHTIPRPCRNIVNFSAVSTLVLKIQMMVHETDDRDLHYSM